MTVLPKLMGGCGNTLFQICTCLAYAIKHKVYYFIPTEIENPHYNGQEVFKSPNLKYIHCNINELTGNTVTYYEPYFHYKEIPKFDCDYLILSGYWQSEKYFSEYRTEILYLLNIPYDYKKGWCSIHVRRTNYLNLPNIHPVVTKEYLEQAQIEMMNKGINKFLIFSDDLEWCKNSMPQFYECEYDISEGRTEYEDLVLASSCEANIGSNSSFSYFIHWLNRNKNKVGIFPKVWFGKDMAHDTKDLYTDEMILL